MRAVGVHEYGGPEALEVVDLPDPVAGPGQVLVRVHAAAVNPTDTFVRNGARRRQQQAAAPPYVPGMDVAGVLAAIGEGTVVDLQIGDAVIAVVVPDGFHGGYSSLLALPADSVVAAPAGTSHEAACTLPMNGLTARLALDRFALVPGQVLAVTGAAGTLGGYLVELAVADGLTVVADASEADEELVRGFGAAVVVRRGDDVAKHIRARFPDGVDALADASVQNAAVFDAIRDGGAYATFRGFAAAMPRGITHHAIWVREYARERAALERLARQAENGVVTLRVADVVAPHDAAQAHRRLEAGGVRGRLVIAF